MAVGVLLALLTSVSWAFGNVFIQKSGRAIGAPRAMLWALFAGGVIAGLLSLALDVRPAPFTASVFGWAVLAGLAGLLAYVCLFVSFARSPLSLAVPVVSSWSLISATFSFVAFGELPRSGPLLGAALVIVGVVLVSLGGSRESVGVEPAPPGDAPTAVDLGQAPSGDASASSDPLARGRLWLAFGSAIGFGIMVPAITHVTPATGEFGATALVYGLELALGIPVARAFGVTLRPPPRAVWPLILITGGVETAGFVAIAFARRYAPMAVVAPVSSLAAALTVLYAWLVLRERPRLIAAVGAALACAGVVALAS